MKIAVINGSPIKGVTYFMKERFLKHITCEKEVAEFYPKDFPPFCTGCKNCFVAGEDKCPHYREMKPIWEHILGADLLVFAYPVYALRAPGAVKTLLDHLCVFWMVHRPDPKLFRKTAVIITNSVGAPNGAAQKDVKTSLCWLGVSNIYTCGAGMMGDIFIDKMSEEHKNMLNRKMFLLAGKVSDIKPRKHMSLKVQAMFSMCKFQHKMVMKNEETPSLDNAYYVRLGWIER